ncbi:MAG: tetratricopeptide repeat protein [Aeromicrobium sp.]|nr:tetratricopeptide repeat protein [Burkholderiales bacterium]
MNRQAHHRSKQQRASSALLEQAQRYAAAGKLLEAEQHFTRAIEADRQSSKALIAAGSFYFKQQRPQQAIPYLSRITLIDPNNAIAWRNLGVGCSSAGDYERAVSAFQHATRLKPDYAVAHHALALSLVALGRALEAIPSFQTAIGLNPKDHDALYNFANALVSVGELPAAESAFHVALSLNPEFVSAHCNLGKFYYSINECEMALRHLSRAVELSPNSAIAHKNLGAVLQQQGKLSEALTSYQTACRLQAGFVEALGNTGSVQLALGNVAAATESYRDALRLQPDHAAVFSDYLFCLQNDHNISNEDLYAAHRNFAAAIEAPQRARWPKHANTPNPLRRLKIGYMSGDLRHHAVAFFLEPILAFHNRENFQLHIYSNHAQVDGMTKRLASYVDVWTPCLHLNDEQLTQKIMADGIDILVDLSGHTAYNRLPVFARKPAPVQVTCIGYGGTTGLDAMDYRITDEALDPSGVTDQWHSETLVRLPGGGAAFQAAANAPSVGPLPALSGNGITLACLNNPRKIRPPVVALWSRILVARPSTRLLLGSASDEALKTGLLGLFAAEGIDATRISFQPWMPLQAYLALHQQIDLALDPFPYNGGTTSYHSLWMGVPFVTLSGDRTMSRVGAGVLASVGLRDWIAETEDAYVEKVLTALDDLHALDTLRQRLRNRLNSGDDARSKRVASELNTAYRTMWQQWCEQQRYR